MTNQPTVIDQSEDFVSFQFDGDAYEVDLFAAHDALRKIDIKHRDDIWECFDCLTPFNRTGDDVSDSCPHCKKKNTRRDEAWLESVAAYVIGLGPKRCGRNAAGQFYNEILERVERLKKKPRLTPGSPSSSTSTPADGPSGESDPCSIS